MKKSFSKRILLAMVALAVMTAAVGCNKADPSVENTSKPTSEAASDPQKIDTSKFETISMWLPGDPTPKLDEATAQLNALIKKDLNAELKYIFGTWTDTASKYNLALSSGEKIDLIYSAQWMQTPTFARKGAFQNLNEMLPVYMSETYNRVSQDTWNKLKVNDEIWMIPYEMKELYGQGLNGVIWREDLRKKYNIPEIKTLADVETYMTVVKKNNPNMLPADVAPGSVWRGILSTSLPYESVINDNSIFVYDKGDLESIKCFYETSEFKQNAELVKKWADMGFWSKSILSKKSDADADFKNGKIAIQFQENIMKAAGQASYLNNEHPDWEIDYLAGSHISKIAHVGGPLINGMAVPKASPNPERALMLMDKLHNDQSYYDLTSYGIEGLNYKVVEDNKITTEGFDPNNGSSTINWGWLNDGLNRKPAGYEWPKYQYYNDELLAMVTPDLLDTFMFDPTNVQAEMAAVQQVESQYGMPLFNGMVEDVDKAIEVYISKLKAAGVEKYRDEYIAQITEYAKVLGY